MIKEQISYEDKIQIFLKKNIEYEKAFKKHFEEKLQDIGFSCQREYINYEIGQSEAKLGYYNYLLGLLHKNQIEKSVKNLDKIQIKIYKNM